MQSVLVICLSPTFQRMMVFKDFNENEVNRSDRILEIASGKGINVSRVLGNLGRPALNLIQLGGPRVEEFLSLCSKDHLAVKYISVEAPIRTCTTIINEKKHTSTELVEESRMVKEGDSEALFSLFLSLIDSFSAVVIAGTKAKGFSSSLYSEIVRECKRRGKLVILDVKGKELENSLLEKPDIIKPNLSELCSTFLPDIGLLENEDSCFLRERVEALLREVYSKYGTRSVITRGKYPSWVFDGNDFMEVESDISLPVVNTIGCGDTLTGALTHSLLNGDTLFSAVKFGMECAVKKASHIEQGI